MKSVGIIHNARIPEALDLGTEIMHQLPLPEDSWISPAENLDALRERVESTGLVITVGGDGTILRAAQVTAPNGIPMVGINMGRLGFMTELQVHEAMEQLPNYLTDGCRLEERTMLQATIIKGNASGGSQQDGPYHALNDVVLARTRNVGVLSAEQAINASATGPVLRASGVRWDLRKADPYDVYDRMEFDVPTGAVGDVFDRYRVRIQEMRESVKIIKQCVRDIPGGPVRTQTPFNIRAPEGDAYAAVEAPKGELGFYLVSDRSISPYRCKIRSPSFINLTPLRDMLIGWKLADLIVIFGSIDVVMGEVDR